MNEVSLPEYVRQSLGSLENSRAARIQANLREAFAQASRDDMLAIAGRAAGHVGRAGMRRVAGVLSLVQFGLRFTSKALGEVASSLDAPNFKEHVKGRASAAWGATVEYGKDASDKWVTIKNAATKDPAGFATTMLVLAAGFQVGGGGLDGNGGIPDLDIPLMGIGEHRSPLTHSIIAGIAIESAARILVDVVATLRDKLPADRDPIFDGIIKIIDDASMGVSAGISYHLLVDGIAQPAPYHGVPSMSIEAHQAVFVGNAAAEAKSLKDRHQAKHDE